MTSKLRRAVSDPGAGLKYLRNRLQYHYLRLQNNDPESIEFYKMLQDRKIREGQAYPRDKGFGEGQIAFLQRRGLQSDADLLDIGCGDLRGGQYIIDYLERGSYTGMDISPEAINTAEDNATEWRDRGRDVELLVNDNLQFTEFNAAAFDWVFANSVFTHLPEPLIRECLENLGRVLREDGLATISYHRAEERNKQLTDTVAGSNLYRYPYNTLRIWAAEYGLSAECDAYEEHPKDEMRMLILRIDTDKH